MKDWLTRNPLLSVLLLAGAPLLLVAAYTANLGNFKDSDVPARVDFNKHIRPILSANCYVCHGPDISTREAGLRLDLRDSALVKLESGNVAVVPGNSGESELIHRVSSTDPEEQMPPKELKKILSSTEVALLKKWIDQGAEWQEHWSLMPPEKPAIPRVRRTWQVENEIDRFVVAALEAQKLAPAAEASKEALIRRLSFVLTGLPPTPEGVQAFLEDDSPDAYEQLVDRLLDSPHFGERWARHWMDLVRFANTRGHEFDYPVIGANQYRDYLIRAFNADVPYNLLVREHLAGDLMDTPRINPTEGFNESAIGTVFFGLGEGKHSPVDTQQEEYDRNDIIIDVTSKTFQGLTVACARCHDHKFDPIPTTDYYALYGIIKSSRYAFRAGNITPDVTAQVQALQQIRQHIRKETAKTWLSVIPDEGVYDVEVVSGKISPVEDAAEMEIIGDFTAGNYDGWMPDGLAFGEEMFASAPVFEGETIVDAGLPAVSSAALSPRLFGVLQSPDFILNHNFITVRAAGKDARIRVIMDNFQLIQDPIYGGLETEIDTVVVQDHTFDLRMWKGKKMYLELLPARIKGQALIREDAAYIEAMYAIAHNVENPEIYNQGVARRQITGAEVRSAVMVWQTGKATGEDLAVINACLSAGVLPASNPAVADLLEEAGAIERALPSAKIYMGVVEGNGADHPVFIRGAITSPGSTPVPRRGFTISDKKQTPYKTAGSGRMHFVESLLSDDNPLTARVMVNRLWHYVFGKGLVETVDNFGVQGKYPSHPELLDYLAVQFREEGWSIKSMLRKMVLSKTFRRATASSKEAQQSDPDNIYLTHYPVRRLEAEAIRDAMLVASGRFNPEMYGEDVPIHLTAFMEGRGRPAVSGALDGEGRRSIYLSVRRNFLQPFMLVFDMPIPFTTFGKRNTSNVPAQSLTLLNDPFVLNQAEYWAREILTLKELSNEQKIEQIYLKGLSRMPSPEEIEEATQFLQTQATTYTLMQKDIPTDPRPWRDLCHTLFNLKEFIHLI